MSRSTTLRRSSGSITPVRASRIADSETMPAV
jgi:hypothetical protein